MPHFSNYFNSQNPKKATKHTNQPLCVHHKSNTKLNTNICLSFMYITHKKNQWLTSNWLVTWSSCLTHWLSLWQALLTTESESFLTEAAIVYMFSVTQRFVSNTATRILICTYKLRTANKTQCYYELSSLGTPDTLLWNPLVPQNADGEALL